ncbi:MAG: hypothetical protein OQK50_03525 [Deltaproteobacteria bacterium]|jgi:hypothetical protein|nr:hypothetical protein [Deltaproteobacteria bacterium]MCW8892774.1 hypothetical protein [Deltaproteobacteria bacterium]MCW9049385.1 hypothetical protein [Deltaproteobacteria bacterium]
MEILDRLEAAVEKLMKQNKVLRDEKKLLLQEQAEWTAERKLLVEEIDLILKRIDSMSLEES